ncbi:hypothetical protein [Labrys neptuniae]
MEDAGMAPPSFSQLAIALSKQSSNGALKRICRIETSSRGETHVPSPPSSAAFLGSRRHARHDVAARKAPRKGSGSFYNPSRLLCPFCNGINQRRIDINSCHTLTPLSDLTEHEKPSENTTLKNLIPKFRIICLCNDKIFYIILARGARIIFKTYKYRNRILSCSGFSFL